MKLFICLTFLHDFTLKLKLTTDIQTLSGLLLVCGSSLGVYHSSPVFYTVQQDATTKRQLRRGRNVTRDSDDRLHNTHCLALNSHRFLSIGILLVDKAERRYRKAKTLKE